MKAISTEGLTKTYGKLTAVDHVSFEVESGEVFGFLGPNGSGKTTTIRMLNTLTSMTDGRATVAGHDVAREQDAVRRSIGLVPQDMTLDRHKTGRNNLRIQAKLYDVDDETYRNREKELLRLVDLEAVAGKLVGTYSWGMQKRLEIAMGLIHTPQVLFLDEPTLGLDARSRQAIWEHIERLNRDIGVTVFMTTHYLEEADSLCDRIAIIDAGKLKAVGTPSELKERLGTDSIVLELQKPADQEELKKSIMSLPGVIGVKFEGFTCSIEATHGEQTLPRVIAVLSGSQVEVGSAKLVRKDLNQVFLKQISSSTDVAEEDEFKMLTRERRLRERT